MADHARRIRLLLSPNNPLDAEILDWLDSLPTSARGTELKPHLTAALIDYIRQQPTRSAIVGRIKPVKPKMPDRPKPTSAQKPASVLVAGAHRAPENGANTRSLARHLLKDFE
jgi:hypothetical protein